MTAVETGQASDLAVVTAAVRTAMNAAGPGRKGRRGRPAGSGPASGRAVQKPVIDGQARVTAAIVLDVLAGMRSTSEAAASLGISPVRYYAIEARAIGALFHVDRGADAQRRGKETQELDDRLSDFVSHGDRVVE